jgi:hypothetical protein
MDTAGSWMIPEALAPEIANTIAWFPTRRELLSQVENCMFVLVFTAMSK